MNGAGKLTAPVTGVRALRLGAALLPASLLLHQGVYAFSSGGDRPSHGYLELLIPLLVAAAVSLAVASLLAQLLARRSPAERPPAAPIGIAAGLIAIFAAQELAEAGLLGGGVGDFLAALAAGWLLLPLALVLGLVVSLLVYGLERTAALLVAAIARPKLRSAPQPKPGVERAAPSCSVLSPLAFGLARRPPPLLSVPA